MTESFTLRDEANAIVAFAFRNTQLEDLHAGEYSSLLEDKSLSRITDEEMRSLMIECCRKMEALLRKKEENPEEYRQTIQAYSVTYCAGWERS